MNHKLHHQSGQIILIAILTLAVAGTIALSLVARGTTDTKITSNVEESSRAFSAAEAGIEEALKTGIGGATTLTSGNATATTTVAAFGSGLGPFTIPRRVSQGLGDTVFLVPHDTSGSMIESPFYKASSLDLCWSKEGATIPALTASLWYKDGSDYKIKTLAVDPDPSRQVTDSFTPVSGLGIGCGQPSVYKTTITFSDLGLDPAIQTLLFLRVRPLYADTTVSVDALGALPIQGNRIEATGVAGSNTTRTVVVYQQYPTPPLLADFVLFSEDALSHE